MNQNPYLIPANTKKGELILGIFRPIDLVIFLVGVGITLLALVIMSLANAIDISHFTGWNCRCSCISFS